MTVKWTFFDPKDSSTIAFEINPDSAASGGGSSSSGTGTASYPPAIEKTITTVATVAPGGKTIAYEGADVAPALSFSGTILTASMYNTMVTWFGKRHQVILTDDLGISYTVYFTYFEPKRVRMASNQHYMTYTVTMQIVDWPS